LQDFFAQKVFKNRKLFCTIRRRQGLPQNLQTLPENL
jgi:hypothetical protein